ncbi:MAG: UDP-N-acetylmuramate dehydrogenase [Thermomicrobiales bacterium]|nr:UDP-N-acetylmuramate dehydrogenase [Thermomicrobiales bacterium]MCO5221014.1 UDP-N-acetylmuramate dehydrogenase [Thermomicrobiales bacterium]
MSRTATAPSVQIPGHPDLKVLSNAPMSNMTTWRIGGPADFAVRAGHPDKVIAALQWAHDQNLPVTVIGGGSNLLVGDDGIRGLVIIARTPGERAGQLVSAEDLGAETRLRVAAQAPLSWVGRYCCDRGWAGMDWGVGLPGAIGGATVNNAGAHGTEMKDHLDRVEIARSDGTLESHDRAWLNPTYRHTRLKDSSQPRGVAVTWVELLLPKGDPARLKQLADEHAGYRHRTQPTGRCAGSTFTNPPGDFAGRLIEEAGLKDFAVGGVRFSTVHSNFIVNDGSGTAEQVLELIAHAQDVVLDRFGVRLETEIEPIGAFTGRRGT